MFLLAVIVPGLKENSVNANRNYAHRWLYIASESCDKIHNIRNDDLPFMWTFAPPGILDPLYLTLALNANAKTNSIVNNNYAGPPCSRTKIYAARMSRGSSSYRSISAARTRPQQQTRCCCRSTGQTDGRTLGPFYDAYRMLRGSRNNLTLTPNNNSST